MKQHLAYSGEFYVENCHICVQMSNKEKLLKHDKSESCINVSFLSLHA